MSAGELHLVVRTPHLIAFEKDVESLRVPTESGQVGLRPRGEAMTLAVEAGLVVARSPGRTQFIGTAGGLLVFDAGRATLLTPVAAAGDDEPAIIDRLEQLLREPDEEMQARLALDRLERQILRQMRNEQREIALPRGGG